MTRTNIRKDLADPATFPLQPARFIEGGGGTLDHHRNLDRQTIDATIDKPIGLAQCKGGSTILDAKK